MRRRGFEEWQPATLGSTARAQYNDAPSTARSPDMRYRTNSTVFVTLPTVTNPTVNGAPTC